MRYSTWGFSLIGFITIICLGGIITSILYDEVVWLPFFIIPLAMIYIGLFAIAQTLMSEKEDMEEKGK